MGYFLALSVEQAHELFAADRDDFCWFRWTWYL